MIEQIDHVNLVVRNLETMTAFYRDVLGFRVTKQVTISGEWVDAVVGLKDVTADVVYLDPPSGPRVELIHYRSPPGVPSSNPSAPNAFGLRHVAFRVSDIDAVVAQLKKAGPRT